MKKGAKFSAFLDQPILNNLGRIIYNTMPIIYNRRRIIYDYLKSGSVCDCKGDLFDVIEMISPLLQLLH